MVIKYRQPMAVCDVCLREEPAPEVEVAGIRRGQHPEHWFTVLWRQSQATCCSKECAIRHIEAT